MTPEQADELIGATGDVVHPSKGVQGPPGGWKCTGYALDDDDPLRVASLKLESVAWTEPTPIHGRVKDAVNGGYKTDVVETIAPHPVEVRPRSNPAWFRPHGAAPTRTPVPSAKPPAAATA